MKSMDVLIVEDELLIAETIKLYLEERNHQVVGIAISYDEATQLIEETNPDVALLDIRLYGEQSGIDVAHYIQSSKKPLPYVIVSSQYDQDYIEKAMQAGASGYITKPIAKETLWSSLELAVLKSADNDDGKFIDLKISHGLQRIKLSEILYIKSDHVYVEVIGSSFKYFGRYSLTDMLSLINAPQFIQCHRSYIINTHKIDKYSSSKVWINRMEIPISAKHKTAALSKSSKGGCEPGISSLFFELLTCL